MAKIISPVWSIIRGSIAGTTYLTTPAGMIIGRQRTSPVNPMSEHQSRVRAALSQVVAEWEALTQAERDDWDVYAAGQGRALTGRQEFISGHSLFRYIENLGVLPVGATYFSTIPEFASRPTVTCTFTAPSAGVGFKASVTNFGQIEIMALMSSSGPCNPSRQFWKGPWDPNGQSLLQIAASATGDFEKADCIEGMRYFVRFSHVTEDDVVAKRGNVHGISDVFSHIAEHA